MLNGALTAVNGAKFDVVLGGVSDVRADIIEAHSPDILVVDVNLGDQAEIEKLERVVRAHGSQLGIVATSNEATLEGVRRLMRLDVADFVPQPFSRTDLLAAIEHAVRKTSHGGKESGATCNIFPFIKAVGGMGATTLAIQTACGLAYREKGQSKICLFDFDLQFGNAALYLDVDTGHSVLDVVQSSSHLDGAFLRGVVAHHKSGVDVLAAPSVFVPLDVLTPEFVGLLLDVAVQEYDHIVIDLPHALTDWTHTVLSRADVISVVAQLSVPAIRQSRRLLDILREEGLGDIPIAVILNRFEKRWGMKVGIKDAEKALNHRIDYFIPNDYRVVSSALNEGVSLAEIKKGSKVEQKINELIESLVARTVESSTVEAAV